ncbi:MAG: response regulator transcription factor, partial [Coriobacteriales bacterium]|nr:response regulator transcription factor [Coriobacteriales bacterium]
MASILIIDDDPYLRELVGAILAGEGHVIREATDGRAAFELLGSEKIDLCVVDVMMPKMDGFEFCQTARRYYEDLPLLMLTAKGQLRDKVQGFSAGADDYLVKPFEAPELVARVKSLLRRYHKVAAFTVWAGKVLLDRNSYTITVSGERGKLPLKEFELLFTLASLPGRTLTRAQLLDEVWGFDFEGNERTLDVHINR